MFLIRNVWRVCEKEEFIYFLFDYYIHKFYSVQKLFPNNYSAQHDLAI